VGQFASLNTQADTSEDLIKRPYFVSPFLLACKSRNAKQAGIGVVCLQRLVSARAVPEEKLTDVVESLKESVSLSNIILLTIRVWH
jgi:hypothetical protein